MADVEVEIKKAWTLREEGNPVGAIGILFPIYYQELESGNKEKAIDILVDIAISWNALGSQEGNKDFYKAALSCINHVKILSEQDSIPLREDWPFYHGTFMTNLKDYQSAQVDFETYLKTPGLPPEKQAEVKAKRGYCKAKSGAKEEGIKMIKDAIETLEKSQGTTMHGGKDLALIWKLGAVMYLAEVLDDKMEAKTTLEKALEEAKQNGLGARQKQVEKLLRNQLRNRSDII